VRGSKLTEIDPSQTLHNPSQTLHKTIFLYLLLYYIIPY
jgi:hypothetical protein